MPWYSQTPRRPTTSRGGVTGGASRAARGAACWPGIGVAAEPCKNDGTVYSGGGEMDGGGSPFRVTTRVPSAVEAMSGAAIPTRASSVKRIFLNGCSSPNSSRTARRSAQQGPEHRHFRPVMAPYYQALDAPDE